ncbi:hypothetical protein HD554DRAFT_2038293 [Boletus coccyginus]|nr:hypothetical protein HD554DRAFT_2038293 [Boletus coccyginus]
MAVNLPETGSTQMSTRTISVAIGHGRKVFNPIYDIITCTTDYERFDALTANYTLNDVENLSDTIHWFEHTTSLYQSPTATYSTEKLKIQFWVLVLFKIEVDLKCLSGRCVSPSDSDHPTRSRWYIRQERSIDVVTAVASAVQDAPHPLRTPAGTTGQDGRMNAWNLLLKTIFYHAHVSSIATFLSYGESIEKHVGLVEIRRKEFQWKHIPLGMVRPFVPENVLVSEASEEAFDIGWPFSAITIGQRIKMLIEQATHLWDNRNKGPPGTEKRGYRTCLGAFWRSPWRVHCLVHIFRWGKCPPLSVLAENPEAKSQTHATSSSFAAVRKQRGLRIFTIDQPDFSVDGPEISISGNGLGAYARQGYVCKWVLCVDCVESVHEWYTVWRVGRD